MTVEEAKKILEKEGFKLKGPGRAGVVSKSFTEYESPKICEAMQIVCSAGYEIMMLAGVFEARKARLKKELKEHSNAPVSGKEKAKEGNPALKEAASQFNDALLDEQAKEIERLKNENAELLGMVERMKKDVKEVDSNFYAVNKENKRLDKKVLELINDKELMKKATLSQLDDFIEIYNLLTKEIQKAKRLGKEIAKLNSIIHDKNAVLSDVAEELRLSKIREKNLVEVSQKYMKENEELKKELERANNLVEVIRKGSKEYCEYGIAAEKMIQKLAKIIVGKGSVTSEDFEKCRRWAKGYRFNPQLPELSEEEEEKLQHAKKYRVSFDKAKEGGDQSAIIVLCDNGIITLSEEEAEIIERCTKNGTELHYSEKDGLTYTNMFGEEIPIIYLRGMFHIFTDEEIKNMKK
jgi:hypothetical protein